MKGKSKIFWRCLQQHGPNEGDIQKWIPVSKATETNATKEKTKNPTPGFDFFMA